MQRNRPGTRIEAPTRSLGGPVEQVDVVVIGMGPGGEDLAGRLAETHLDVIGIDQRLVGGECPYFGCIPSKMMIRAGNALAEGRRIPGLAGDSRVMADWAPVAARIRNEATDDWNDQVAVDRFEGKGGRFVRGHGRLTGPKTVAVGDREFEARRAIVLNTGTDPVIPPIPGLAGTPLWTNREAIQATQAPASLIVLGGGAIGVELAQVFARFGSHVTVVEAAPHLVSLEEPDAGALLADVFAHEGIDVRVGVSATAVRHDGAGFSLDLADGNTLRAERVLVATGRKVDLGAVGLDTVGIDITAHAVPVDTRMRVAPGIWAIGDMTGKGAFTHISMYQADIALADILGVDGVTAAEYDALPRVTFTDPEIGSVGMTLAQAMAAGIDVLVGRAALPSTARGWIHGPGNDGLIKLIADADRGVLVGATTVGPSGGEMLSALVVAVHAAVPLERLRSMIYAYPTFHRGILDAVKDLRRPA
jgi:pyruvate/2-oxoglutarate dehydrogenase complex dihydrolipoamide dehydrogenase (E3) component